MQWMPPPLAKISRASTSSIVAVGEGLAEDGRGLLVAGVVEGAEDDGAVGDVVVDVGVVDRLAVLVVQDGRGGDLDDLQAAAGRVGRGAQQGDQSPGRPSWSGCAGSGWTWATTTPGRTKEATMSMWPRVPNSS